MRGHDCDTFRAWEYHGSSAEDGSKIVSHHGRSAGAGCGGTLTIVITAICGCAGVHCGHSVSAMIRRHHLLHSGLLLYRRLLGAGLRAGQSLNAGQQQQRQRE